MKIFGIVVALSLMALVAYAQPQQAPARPAKPATPPHTEGITIDAKQVTLKVTKDSKLTLVADGITFDLSGVSFNNDAALTVSAGQIKEEEFSQGDQVMKRYTYLSDGQTIMKLVRGQHTIIRVTAHAATFERPKGWGE